MDGDTLKSIIQNLSIWKKGEQRAPHKPLLMIYALSRVIKDKSDRFISYKEVGESLKQLLIEFGPRRQSYHPEHPFVRLKNDGIWELSAPIDNRSIKDKLLLANNVSGGFTSEVFNLLSNNDDLVKEIVYLLLNQHFPESIHEDILEAVGLEFSSEQTFKKRDPKFRERILRAYGYSCAVCGFNVRLGNSLVGVEAAHIKWHQAGGPDTEDNGIALCSLHHKLFDRGVFTISESRSLLVSEDAHGTFGFEEWLMKYHGNLIKEPVRKTYEPNNTFLNWHIREVFRGPSRYFIN